ARTLFSSINDTETPNLDFYVLILDQIEKISESHDPRFQQLRLSDLGLETETLEDMKFRYNVVEFATAVKPTLLRVLLEQKNYLKAIYFDPDILVLAPLDPLVDELDGASMILTPHLLASPPDDECRPTEREILISGCFNLGFIGLSKVPEALRFLGWWEAQLRKLCLWHPEKGLFVDQRWLDLAPSMVQNLRVLRSPGYNVAFWNLHERVLTFQDGRFLAGGKRLTFFHFSGFNPRKPSELSRHQTRHRMDGVLGNVVDKYVEDLRRNRYEHFAAMTYAFDFWDNGIRIPAVARRLYIRVQEAKNFRRPLFSGGSESFFSWMTTPQEGLPPLLEEIWQERVDLREAFPDPLLRDQSRFWNWVSHRAEAEYQLDEKLIFLLELSFSNIQFKTKRNLLIGENHFEHQMPSHH
ncbi:MAG: hypothetical protein K2X47_00010, partial [Bdellovibrionales bacterium]|nr:hypothetical protein [Bdellovibrionales bacterium]